VPAPSNRNSVGQGTVGLYVVGLLCVVVGIYLSTITRLNLVTGQTSNPYVGAGIPLAVGGVVVVIIAQRRAKQNLRK
jgi:hypothetical protein